jgi:hypothetical protein
MCQVLAEGAHFHLRAGTQPVQILRHLLGRADDVVLVAVVHVAKERRGRRRRLRLLPLLSEGRRGARSSQQRDHEQFSHHAGDYKQQIRYLACSRTTAPVALQGRPLAPVPLNAD